jgi:hypothetical protein
MELLYVTTVAVEFDPMALGIARDDTPDDLGSMLQMSFPDAKITWLELDINSAPPTGTHALLHITIFGTYEDCERVAEELGDSPSPVIPIVIPPGVIDALTCTE